MEMHKLKCENGQLRQKLDEKDEAIDAQVDEIYIKDAYIRKFRKAIKEENEKKICQQFPMSRKLLNDGKSKA